MKKLLLIISILVAIPLTSYATAGVPIMVPSAPTSGYILQSITNGTYAATSTLTATLINLYGNSGIIGSIIPSLGQLGYETDTNFLKMGDGNTTMSSLTALNPFYRNSSGKIFANNSADKFILGTTVDDGIPNVFQLQRRASDDSTLDIYDDSLNAVFIGLNHLNSNSVMQVFGGSSNTSGALQASCVAAGCVAIQAIGGTNPEDFALDLQGNTHFNQPYGFLFATTTCANYFQCDPITIFDNVNSPGGILLSGASGNSYKWKIGATRNTNCQTGASSQNNPFDFVIASSTSLCTNKLFVINGQGNIGVGSSSPNAQLSVLSASSTVQKMLFAVATSTAGAGTTTPFVVNWNGNVGVSTSTPGTEFSVNGLSLAQTYAAYGTSASIFPYASTTVISSVNNAYFGTVADGTARVSIGTTSPRYNLHILGNANSGTTVPGIELEDAACNASSKNWLISNGYNSFGSLEFSVGSASCGLVNNTGAKLTITSGGVVGISTTTPNSATKLDVYNSGGTVAGIFKGSGAGAVGIGSVSQGAFIQGYTDDSATATGNLIIQTTTGSGLFIGTTTSAYGCTFCVKGAAATWPLWFTRNGGGGSLGITMNNLVGTDAADVLFASIPDTLSNSAGFLFQTTNAGNGANAIAINGAAQTGLGTTTPNTRLTVNGVITATTTAPTLSSCGTSPSINGSANGGEVTAGATATGCTVTFATAFPVAAFCAVTPQTGSVTNTFSYTVSKSAITVTETGLGGTKFNYVCFGY